MQYTLQSRGFMQTIAKTEMRNAKFLIVLRAIGEIAINELSEDEKEI